MNKQRITLDLNSMWIIPARNAPIDNPPKTRIHFQVELVLLSDTNGTLGPLDRLSCCRSCSLELSSSGTYLSNGNIKFGLGKVTKGGDSTRLGKVSVDTDEDLLNSSNILLESLGRESLKSMVHIIYSCCFTTKIKMEGTWGLFKPDTAFHQRIANSTSYSLHGYMDNVVMPKYTSILHLYAMKLHFNF